MYQGASHALFPYMPAVCKGVKYLAYYLPVESVLYPKQDVHPQS